MNVPDKVPMTVIDSIAKSHVRFERQGQCPRHDGRFNGHWCGMPEDAREDNGFVIACTCRVHTARFEDILKALRWSFGHYSFDFAGMYVGVELDGYMHT